MNRPYVLFLFSLICIISVFPAALAAAETGPGLELRRLRPSFRLEPARYESNPIHR